MDRDTSNVAELHEYLQAYDKDKLAIRQCLEHMSVKERMDYFKSEAGSYDLEKSRSG